MPRALQQLLVLRTDHEVTEKVEYNVPRARPQLFVLRIVLHQTLTIKSMKGLQHATCTSSFQRHIGLSVVSTHLELER